MLDARKERMPPKCQTETLERMEEMKIGLIDVDGHRYPNLPLMKLSAWHKSRGDSVEWWENDLIHYDIVYMAKVFSDQYSLDAPEPMNADKVIKGGTGYAIELDNGREVYQKRRDAELPYEIEHIYPDYSLYPEFLDTAYGFLTRGCPRRCAFCHVAGKEGCKSQKVADLSEFWRGQSRTSRIACATPAAKIVTRLGYCPSWQG